MSAGHTLKQLLRRGYHFCRRLGVPNVNRFLREVEGVIHVGANVGQEREEYAERGLKVLWVEPIPEIFAQLQQNLRPFPMQRAVNHLVTERDGVACELFVSDNRGESSSILPLEGHREMWPTVSYAGSIVLQSVTLPTLFEREGVDLHDYQALILDTQGSEHLVLQGAEKILRRFKYLKLEAPDFESYKGCWTDRQLADYLHAQGFREMVRHRFSHKENLGSYYDIAYQRLDDGPHA